jgi:hypothetical protein
MNDCSSDNSGDRDDSIAEESVLRGSEEKSNQKLSIAREGHCFSMVSNNLNMLTDEAQNYMLY